MCGIVGYYGARHFSDELEQATLAIAHRGPDHLATRQYCQDNIKIGFGHTRLSILDLDNRSHQPFKTTCGQVIVIFNGEIYNYRELRHLLQERGLIFRTHSDTEVLANAFLEFSEQAFEKLIGIFSFAILDLRTNQLLLARDQLGIKPLYYSYGLNNQIYFSSEIKSLFKFSGVQKKICEHGLTQSLSMTFPLQDNSGFKSIKKLPPGSYLTVRPDAIKQPVKFHSFDWKRNVKSSVSTWESELSRASIQQSHADVATALLFSGGIDSTTIAIEASEDVALFFADYNDKELAEAGLMGDRHFAMEIAAHLKKDLHIHQMDLQSSNIFEDAHAISLGVEEPIADYTYKSSQAICKLARDSGFKVVLSGMGGDEAFAGYPRHQIGRFHSAVHKVRGALPLFLSLLKKRSAFSKKVDRLYSFSNESNVGQALAQLTGYFSHRELHELFGEVQPILRLRQEISDTMENASSLSPLKRAMYFDSIGFLSHNLVVADKSSMSVGVELRVPLLDPVLFQEAISLRSSELTSFFSAKKPLKKFLQRKVPRELLNRPKSGFNPPLDAAISNTPQADMIATLLNGPISNFLCRSSIRKTIDNHYAGTANNTYKLWQLVFSNAWLQNFY